MDEVRQPHKQLGADVIIDIPNDMFYDFKQTAKIMMVRGKANNQIKTIIVAIKAVSLLLALAKLIISTMTAWLKQNDDRTQNSKKFDIF